jgi:hypothetical protein
MQEHCVGRWSIVIQALEILCLLVRIQMIEEFSQIRIAVRMLYKRMLESVGFLNRFEPTIENFR